MIGIADVEAAAERIAGRVLRTPTLHSPTISRAVNAEVYLKLENLQAIGSFKERGAANRIALLTEAQRRAGVVAMSAGNHAQAVARHAQLSGIRATIVMPQYTPASKVTRTRSWGAEVVLHGANLVEAAEHALLLAARDGLTLVHPYDDPAVMAGQGTMALEMLQDAPELDVLVIPVGGGGMISGAAVVAAALRPGLEVVGVQVEAFASLRAGGRPVSGGPTIAEGIAVARVGNAPREVIEALVSEVLVVGEHAIEDAVTLLAEGAKQVAEGAGAAGIAALLEHPDRFAGRRVGTTVCGGNIDSRILANVLQRHLLRDGRLLRLMLEIPDRPGVLADIATRIGDAGGNIIEVVHQRLFDAPSVQAAELELMIEARDSTHADSITQSLARTYTVRRL